MTSRSMHEGSALSVSCRSDLTVCGKRAGLSAASSPLFKLLTSLVNGTLIARHSLSRESGVHNNIFWE